jgi:hypothetical protein
MSLSLVRAHPGCDVRRPAQRGCWARWPDPNWCTVRRLRYFAAVLAPKSWGSYIRFYGFELGWSYGDSNSGPLACHQQATHPPEYVAAGHRPAACMPIRSRPGQLRYFRAVLSGPSAGVRGRCSTSRWTSGDHAFRSAQCAFRCREECALFSKRRGAVHGSSAGRHVIDVFGRSAEALKMVRALLAR